MRQRSRRPGRAYAAIPNAAMRDQRVSIEARGLLALMMTYADEWTFVFSHLQDLTGVGRDKLRKMLKELETAGYIFREIVRCAKGELGGTEWVIVDDPAEVVSGGHNIPQPQDDGEQGENPDGSRQPEIQGIGENGRRETEIQGIGGHRCPETPTAVFSGGHIRKPIYKNPPNPPPGGRGVEDRFSDFWMAYPHRVGETAARRAWGRVATAENVEAIIGAAEAYAGDGRVRRGYPKLPGNWLLDRCWEDGPALPESGAAAPRPVDLDALSDLWAPKIATGEFVPSSAISCSLARHMLAQGRVSEGDLRRASIAFGGAGDA